MKRILITGASGFIGTHLIKKYHKSNFLYLLDKKKLKINLTKKSKFKFFKQDLTRMKREDFKKFGKIDIIFHCASIIGVAKVTNPFEIHNQIVTATSNLFSYFEKKKILIVYFSSSEIYGNQTTYTEDRGERIYTFNVRQKFKDIRWVYGESKFFIETCLDFMSKKNKKLKYLVIRPFNFFGPYQDKIFVIPKMISDLKMKKKITIYQNKKSNRTFTYIDDAINIIDALIRKKITYNNIYNVGSKNTFNIYKLGKKIISMYAELKKSKAKDYKIVINKKIKDPVIERKPKIKNIKKALGEVTFSQFSNSLKKTMKFYLRSN